MRGSEGGYEERERERENEREGRIARKGTVMSVRVRACALTCLHL